MQNNTRPIVYISYRWIDVFDQGRRGRAPDPRAREIADRLRENGIDVRFDVYYKDSLHGFEPPEPVAGDPMDPWFAWLSKQIMGADVVLLFCTPEYAKSDPDGCVPHGEWWNWCQLDESTRINTRVPGLWWDWYAMAQECIDNPSKFVPIGDGSYHRDQIPAFIGGASYINLSNNDGFDALLRRIRQIWRKRNPRRGVFISYAHKDDQYWFDTLLSHLSWLEREYGIEIWSDRDIAPGARWHESIQTALDLAKVAILLVSPDFLSSSYIASNELPKMLQATETDGVTIFWVPVRQSAYKHSQIAAFQSAHPPEKPLSTLSSAELDQALVDIGEKLSKALGLTTSP